MPPCPALWEAWLDQNSAQGSAQFVFICGYYENWVCLLLLCEMYKYLWSRKGEEGEEETETNGSSRQHFRLFGRRKIIRKFVVPSATLASLNTHAQVKMHNRQLKWKLTHELVSHSSHFHLEHQQQAHSTGEIVHKLSAQQSLAAPTKAARAGMGSSSRNRKQEQQRERERESLSPLTNQSPKCKPRS